MKKINIIILFYSLMLIAPNLFSQTASVTWALSNVTQLTSANIGNAIGTSEGISIGSGRFGMSVFDYTSNGQRLWEGTAGWIAGTEEATRYIQFDAQASSVTSLTITNVSFNYGAAGVDNNIKSNAYYSTDGWKTKTLLNPNLLSYAGSGMLSFSQSINVTIASGSTFSLRIYPYSVVNSSPMAPSFAVHNNVVISGANVSKKNSSLQLTNASGKWGKLVLLTARLQETSAAGNTNISNKMISFSREQDSVSGIVNAKYMFIGSGTTDINGVASISYTIPQDSISSLLKAPQDSAMHTIKAEFTGDIIYNAQSSTGKLAVVRHNAGLTVTPITGTYGQPVVFTATLIDNDNSGKGVSNQTVKFYKIFPGTRVGDTVRVYIGSSKTNSNGIASLSYTLPQDSVINSISASFSGDANYSPKNGTGTFTKILKNSTLQVTNTAGKWGKQIFLTAKLQEISATGNINLSNKIISFSREQDSLNGIGNTKYTFIGSGTTDANGVASISYTIPQDSVSNSLKAPQDSVTHTIRAEFTGDGNYSSQRNTSKLIVVRHVSSLAVAPTTTVYGQPVVFTATLTDKDNGGKGVSNQVLKFYKISPGTRDGDTARVFIGSGKTNFNGVASLSYTSPQDSVISSISVSYVGDANYSSIIGRGTFTTSLKNSAMQITNAAGKWNTTVQLTAKLLEPSTAGNIPLPNKLIKFYFDKILVNQGTTNASGMASVMYTIPQDSVSNSISIPQDSVAHSLTASFSGDANYNSQSIVGKLIVVRHTTRLAVAPSTAVYGQPVVFTATLLDNDNGGKGIPNQVLKFYYIPQDSINQKYIGSGATNSSGVASLAVIGGVAVAASVGGIIATFPGDINYGKQSVTGKFTFTSVENNLVGLPTKYDLLQNYPNPFNPVTSINYSLPKESRVLISVFNILGQRIADLVDEIKTTGNYNVTWGPKNFSSGVYFSRITAIPINGESTFTKTNKMILLK